MTDKNLASTYPFIVTATVLDLGVPRTASATFNLILAPVVLSPPVYNFKQFEIGSSSISFSLKSFLSTPTLTEADFTYTITQISGPVASPSGVVSIPIPAGTGKNYLFDVSTTDINMEGEYIYEI